ncbi:MAG TPA: substrate-binding domain-containing protein [Lacipirellulaceae bacterium]|jgi:ribose transport system substrate-binding protein|nr:substrate-binding domain-containing protein [Lacipirellulaceae bacterium]
MTKRSLFFPAGRWLILFAAISGCNRSPDQSRSASVDKSAAASKERLTIAVIPKAVGGEFWETVEQGARDAARELDVDIKWEGALTETELAEQNKIIENMVNLDVDGMALAPLSNRTMRRPVEDAVEAGIPVVIFDSAVDGDSHISFVATDNRAGGALAGKFLIDRLGESKKRLFLLRFIQGTASTEERAQGFLETVEAAGFEVLASPNTEDATVAGAIKTASNTLERFVKDGKLEIDGMFATNLYSTEGLLEALKDLRKSGVQVNVVFVGFDTNPKLIEEMNEGNIDAMVSQKPQRMGYLAVETIVKHLRGEKVEPRIDTGVEMVTAERLKNEPEIRKLVGLE